MTDYINPCGWLSLSATHFPCKVYDHDAVAVFIVENFYDDETNGLSYVNYLEKLGWCRIDSFHEVSTDHDKINDEQAFWIIQNIDFFRPDSHNHILLSLLRLGYIDNEIFNNIKKRRITLEEYRNKYNF